MFVPVPECIPVINVENEADGLKEEGKYFIIEGKNVNLADEYHEAGPERKELNSQNSAAGSPNGEKNDQCLCQAAR